MQYGNVQLNQSRFGNCTEIPWFNTVLVSWIGGLCANYSIFDGKTAHVQFLHLINAKVIKLAFHSAEKMRERRRKRSMGKGFVST